MNKKVFISMSILTIVFLVGMYIAKIFFPEQFMMAIQNEQLIKIGSFIDARTWLYYICCGICSFITYWLYCCAVCHKKYLKWWECLYIVATIVVVRVVSLFDVNISTAISWTSFAFLPALMKGDIKTCGIIYTFHSVSQCISLSIRNFMLYLTTNNFITSFLMTVECYFWLLLFYIIFNYKNKQKEI